MSVTSTGRVIYSGSQDKMVFMEAPWMTAEAVAGKETEMADEIKWEILEDGTISTSTDAISGTNHQSADDLLKHLHEMAGGDIVIKQRKGHTHTHTHKHEGARHTH